MLGNSSRDLIPIQKQYLYKYCVLPIALYSVQLWYYNKAPLAYPLKELGKMQKRASLWILDVFHISPSVGIEAITSLMPIYLYLWKLIRRFYLRAHSLPVNHIIKSILEVRPLDNIKSYLFSLNKLTLRQHTIIKSSIIDMDNRFNEIVPFFSLFNYEFSLKNRLINVFPNQFLFYLMNRKSYLTKLDNLIL